MTRAAAALVSIAVAVAAGCTQRTDLLPPQLDMELPPPACSGLGTPIRIGGSDGPCAGALAASTVNRALCSCDSIDLAGGLFTQATSGSAPGQMGGGGSGGGDLGIGGGGGGVPPPGYPTASVASDGDIDLVGSSEVGGDISAGGTFGISFSHSTQILGDLRSAANFTASQIGTVTGDAYVAADVAGRVVVLGTLYVSPDSTVSQQVVTGDFAVQPIDIAPPCNCTAGPVVDVAAVVDATAAQNDNAAAGLDATALATAHGPTAFTLPCGSYYLPSLTSDDTLEVHVQGRSALYIGGDVSLADGLRVTLDDTAAELDLFVGGNVSVETGMVGATSAAAVRLWLASSSVQLGTLATLSAIVYAPDATFLANDGLNATGALFVGGLAVGGDVSVRFDPGVFADGEACGESTTAPPP
ncbi:MAG TPA: hypothetical protein VIA18_11720 [Polyangia bacterium]|nr:hypothetical protein [Polyangia bacterium]